MLWYVSDTNFYRNSKSAIFVLANFNNSRYLLSLMGIFAIIPNISWNIYCAMQESKTPGDWYRHITYRIQALCHKVIDRSLKFPLQAKHLLCYVTQGTHTSRQSQRHMHNLTSTQIAATLWLLPCLQVIVQQENEKVGQFQSRVSQSSKSIVVDSELLTKNSPFHWNFTLPFNTDLDARGFIKH